jgi:hypothetical protein
LAQGGTPPLFLRWARKMEVIRKFPWDVWAAIVVAILAVVFDVVFYRAPFTFFLIVALALGGYTAKMLSEREPH